MSCAVNVQLIYIFAYTNKNFSNDSADKCIFLPKYMMIVLDTISKVTTSFLDFHTNQRTNGPVNAHLRSVICDIS